MRYTITFSLASLLATSALAEVPRVVTDTVPVHALVATVMGDLGTPELLLDRGANPHDFQLRPSQAKALANAALLVWIGPELTPWLDRALTGLEVNSPRLGLLATKGTHRQNFGAGMVESGAEPSGHDHAHDDGHDDGHDPEAKAASADGHAGHDGHDHSGLDPHAWLDPHNAEVWLSVIATELGRLDPANAAIYAANATSGQADIKALEAELATALDPIKGKPFVVFHDAYGYFTGHFGLTQTGAVRLGDATTPGAARLTGLRNDLGKGTAVCLFPEANHDPAQMAQLAEGSGATLGGALDPAGSHLAPGPAAYGDLMRGLAATLVSCLTKR